MESHVELRDVEAEQLDAPAEIGQRAVGDACAAVGAQARVHQLEIGEQRFGVGVARLGRAVRADFEAPADEAQLAPVRLVEVLIADLGREGGQLVLVRSIERRSSSLHAAPCASRRRSARELAHLDAVARQRQRRARSSHSGSCRPGLGITVLVTADPGAEAQR